MGVEVDLRSVVDNAGDGVVVAAADGGIVYRNAAAAGLSGIAREEAPAAA